MAHQNSVEITTPIPSIEEVGESLGMDKARQQSIIQIVRKADPKIRYFTVKPKKSGSFAIKKKANGKVLNSRKKSKSAAAQD